MKRILPPALFLFTLFLAGSVLTGCGDELLPPEEEEGGAKQQFYIIDRSNTGVIPISEDGERESRISLPGRLNSPISENGLVAVVANRKVHVVEIATGNTIATLAGLEDNAISSYSAAISPDGKRVGFSVITPVGDTSQRQLHLVDIDGSNRVVVDVGPGYEQFLRFSPDGSQVAFFDGYEYQDYFSIDSDPDLSGELYVVSSSDGSKRKISETTNVGTDGAVQIEWSPDGSRIVYQDYGDEATWLIDVATAERALLLDGPSLVNWSPDGDRIVLIDSEGKLLVYDMENLDSPRTVNVDRAVLYPHWLADGERVVGYVLDSNLSDFDSDRDPGDLAIISIETGEITTLAPNSDVWYIFADAIVD